MHQNHHDLASIKAAFLTLKMKASALKDFLQSDQLNALFEQVDNFLNSQEEMLDMQKANAELVKSGVFYKKAIDHYSQALYSGKSLLMFAAQENHLELLQDILASPKTQVNQACEDCCWDLVGGETMACYVGQEDGYTALMYAIKEGNVEAAEHLIRAFAFLYQQNSQGENAFKLARNSRCEPMQQLLQRARAIQAQEILGSLMTCQMREVTSLIDLQQKLGIPKSMVVDHLLNHIPNIRYQVMLLRQALALNSFTEPSNPLALYMSIGMNDLFSASDENTRSLLQSRLKTLLTNQSWDSSVPFAVMTNPGKPAFFSYPLAYGPQQTRHPFQQECHNGSALVHWGSMSL